MQKTGPRHKQCRRVGQALCGRPNCPANKRPYPPGQHGRGRKRLTEYHTRLVEKQKLRAIYHVGERAMRKYYERASRKKGVTGVELLRQLETRVDNLVLRLGYALTIRQARQLVSHGHVKVAGRRINVPSAQVRPGETIEMSAAARNFIPVRDAVQIQPDPPAYVSRNASEFSGTLLRLPERDEMPLPVVVEERLIVEHYS